MTNTEETEAIREDGEYEVLPDAKSLNLPLGIRCMEVNVQEVDKAVRLFTQKATDILSPSWKFPNVTLEKLDVTHVMNVFRAHNGISDSHLYMELMELLIDRLYYAIMTSYEFVNGLESAFTNVRNEVEDQPAAKRAAKKTRDWDPLEIAKKASEDNTPKPFHTANIGMLVRQFCSKMIGLENIVLNNISSIRKSDSKADGGASQQPKDIQFLPRHAATQTKESSKDGCETCFIAQNILKFVAEKVDKTLRSLNQAESQITKVRSDLLRDCLNITQRGALLRWSRALETDCNGILECANMLLDINVKSQDDIRALKEDAEIKEERYEKQVGNLQQTVMDLEESLKTEREGRTKVTKVRDASIIKLSEMEKILHMKVTECGKLSQEREALQKSFAIAEELNLQIKCNLAKSTTDIVELKNNLESETKQKDMFSFQVRNLSEELAKTGQELLKLREKADLAGNYGRENEELQEKVSKLRESTALHKGKATELKNAVEEKDLKIKELSEELRKAHSKIELLTLYPDLNGPINTPTKATTGSSCVETMEMQVKSNQVRMQVLKAQSERLSVTVRKLKEHLKSRADARGGGSNLSVARGESL